MTVDKLKQHWKTIALGVLVLGIVGIIFGTRYSNQVFADTTTNQGNINGAVVAGQVSPTGAVAVIKGDYQEVTIDLKSNSYGKIVVQKGIPVKFNIRATADAINGCNNVVVFPDFGKDLALKPGDNVVEFTPETVGTLGYSCWMGMIYSQITVVDDLGSAESAAASSEVVVPNGTGLGGTCCQRP